MALPTIIAVNQTGSAILLTRLGLTVPASGSLTLSDFSYRDEIWGDESLYAFVVAGDIKLNLGQGVLSTGDSLKYWNLIPFQPITISVRAMSIADETLTGTTTIDGVALVAGNRVLLTAQAPATENGVWVVQAGAWARPDDFGAGQAAAGTLVTVEGEGTVYKNQVWTCSKAPGSDVIDTDTLTFVAAASGGSGSTTLQQAYENGNTILTSAGEGTLQFTTGAGAPISFVLTGDDFNVNGANDVNFGGGTALSTFNVDTTGAITIDSTTSGGISIDAVTASNFTVTGASQDLTLSSVGGSVIVQGTEAAADAVRINASNAAGGIDVDAGTAGISIATTGAGDFQTAGALTLDSSGGSIGIGTDADTGAINIGTAASARAITMGNLTGATSTTIRAGTGNITLQAARTTITGDLVVQGTTTSVDSETVLIADNHLYLNQGYTTAVAVTGGLVVNYLPIATATTVAAGGFTAGVAATSNPTVATVGAATFAVGQFIQISGSNNIDNDGLYEVLSHAANVLTVRGVGTTATVEDFTQNQFTTDPTVAGSITRVNVSVNRTGTDGIWESGKGAVTPVTFNDFVTTGSGGSLSLQSAYNGGATITTASATDIAFTLTSGGFTVNGASAVDFGGSTSLTTFNVDTTGAITVDGAGVSIDGTSASNFSTTGANLTLSTITSGTLAVTGAAAVNISSGTTTDIQATGNVTIDSSGGSLNMGTDANTGAINIGTAASARTLTVGNNTGATAVIVNSGTEQVQIDGITYYGAGTGAPTARSGGFQDGDKYYDTNLDMEMRYDATRAKWLSVEAMYIQFGRNGNTAVGSYYMGPDGKVMSSTSGFAAPYAGTIVGLGWTRSDTDAATFDVVEGGTSRATVAHSAVSGTSNALNGNFSAGGVIAVLNQSGGNVTSDVMAWVKLKWRI